MSACDYQIFCNKTAMDTLKKIAGSSDPDALINEIVHRASFNESGSENLDSETAESAAAALAVVYTRFFGYDRAIMYSGGKLEQLCRASERISKKNLEKLAVTGQYVLERILDRNSALNEKWQNDPVNYPLWSGCLLKMINGFDRVLCLKNCDLRREPAVMLRIYSSSEIKSVDDWGIHFRDGSEISFPDCTHAPWSMKCVAYRDGKAFPPYFDFFTTGGRTRLRFDKGGIFGRSQNRREFEQMHQAIKHAGFSSLKL